MRKSLLKTPLLILCLLTAGITAYAQTLEWVQSMGGTGSDQGKSMATDKDGNVYVTGTFSNTADFNQRRGIDTFKSYGSTDIYLAKYDAAGNYLWAIQMGGTSADDSRGVTVDASGNVYVVGYFVLKATFDPAGGDTLRAGAGFNDIFVAKYDGSGQYKWAINMGGSGINYGYGIAVSEAGEVYVTGAFSGKTDFNPGLAPADTAYLSAYPVSFFNPGYDIFIAKYDSAGKYMWAQSIGSDQSSDYGYDIAVDKSGNAYVTGYFSSWADFDPGPGIAILEATGTIGYDGFVAKYDKDGKYLWAKGIGSKYDDNGLGIAVDKGNNAYVTGYFSDTAYFYDTTSTPGAAVKSDSLISAGNYDMFLAKYDSTGNYLWSETLGSTGDEVGYGISIGRGEMICITGYFEDTAIFKDGDTLRAVSGTRDAFIAKFDAQGRYRWAGSMGSSQQSDIGYGVVCDQQGNIYAAGNYSGNADLDPGPGAANFLSKGVTDIYLLKLLCSDTSTSSLQQKACGESFTLNGSTYTASGTYKQILTNSAGCDSTITLFLELSQPEAIIDVNGYTLSTTRSFTTYQWIKDGVAIDGATDSVYIVTANDRYQVAVTNEDGCPDTSDVYIVTNVGVSESNIATQVKIYPNPVRDILHIASPVAVNAVLTTVEGKSVIHINDAKSLSLGDLPGGIYFLRISDEQNRLIKTDKVIKE